MSRVETVKVVCEPDGTGFLIVLNKSVFPGLNHFIWSIHTSPVRLLNSSWIHTIKYVTINTAVYMSLSRATSSCDMSCD